MKFLQLLLSLILAMGMSACFDLPEETFDVQIHWQPVTEFEDGTGINAIDHYQIHYGTALSQLDKIIISRTPDITSYIIKDLQAGEYYFSMVALADNGEKSAMSSPYYFQVSDSNSTAVNN